MRVKNFTVSIAVFLQLLIIDACGSGQNNSWDSQKYARHGQSQMMDAQAVISQLPDDKLSRILDVGCGTGTSTQLLLDRYPQAEVTGIDPSQSMINYANHRFSYNRRVQLLKFSAEDYIAEKPYDMVFSSFALHWIPKESMPLALKNIGRNLRNGGILCCIFSSSKVGLPFQRALDKTLSDRCFLKLFSKFKDPQVFYTVDEFRCILEKEGFFINEIGYFFNKKTYLSIESLRKWVGQWLSYSRYLVSVSHYEYKKFMDVLMKNYMTESKQVSGSPVTWGEYVLIAKAKKTVDK
ncbi:Trans-aconitate 2-methyltransferase [invertebrate metagenome]|uniref:Trans-aconitate 2-methyltransferase n=1 Tax=invertebrate metagenome TaxID=1711999 RepID=A0A2H9T938_9ZZZZ